MNGKNLTILSVVSNSLFVILKFIVGFVTGSVAIMSEAIHSCMDLFASVITFFSIRIANKPADENHPYGHGKAENIAGTIETLLIVSAGVWIIYESLDKFFNPHSIYLPQLGIIVLILGSLTNFIISRIINHAAKRENSIAMKSNVLHLMTDVFTSLGVAISLLLVTVTKWYWLDPAIAISTALFIFYEAIKMLKESFPPLMDNALPIKEEQKIKAVIEHYNNQYIEYHLFRTRRSGAEVHVDFHLVVSSTMPVSQAHQLCEQIEQNIAEIMNNKVEVLIHIEPEEERVYSS